jgi:vacuolar protein sorting-associated protein 13A/C
LKKNAIKLVGSTELLGNPMKLVTTISTGLSNFKNKPFQGEGVTGFLKGAFWGTVSLGKNTVEGSFGFL